MPIPILAVGAFIGLIVYSLLGMVIGVLSVRVLGINSDRMSSLAKWERSKVQDKYDYRPAVVSAAIFWPVWLVLVAVVLVVGAVVVAVGAGPVWLFHHATMYVAGAVGDPPEENELANAA